MDEVIAVNIVVSIVRLMVMTMISIVRLMISLVGLIVRAAKR